MIRLLVTGGRELVPAERIRLLDALEAFHRGWPIDILIHGACPNRWQDDIELETSSDMIADKWARDKGIRVEPESADWNTHGRGAGPRRNQLMIDKWKPTHAIAAVGGDGTADCVRRLKRARVPTINLGES